MNLTAQHRDGWLEDYPLSRCERAPRRSKKRKYQPNQDKQQTIQRKIARLKRETAKETA